jgi:hypothetical protein
LKPTQKYISYVSAIFQALTLLILLQRNAYSAEIRQTDNKVCAFRLSGTIESGDYDRLLALISKNQRSFNNLDARTSTICLTSPGGSYSEGLKIAELIFNRSMSTLIEPKSECYSSCAIIFMAGVTPNRLMPLRLLSARGVLGFHAPYLKTSDERYTKKQLEDATQSMRVAILKLVEFSSKKTKLGGGDFIKKSLIHRILEKGPTEVIYVKTISEAARWGIEIYDATEIFPKANNVQEMKNLCTNFHFSNMDEEIPLRNRLSVRVEPYASKFHRDTFRILVQNDETHEDVCEIYPTTFNGSDTVKFYACSYDYWSSKNFGDCRNYKTTPAPLIGRFVPTFYGLNPATLLKYFTR